MNEGFPQITKQTKEGENGVNIVARIVNSLEWIFRRNHNEHDFGIDGYIDLVTDSGAVTGRCIAVQIKCGESYLQHQDKYGFVYYGNNKHLNYLINHPLPVIIILCEPNTEKCYWEKFDPLKTESTQKNWKLCIPFENKLGHTSKKEIENIAGPAKDYMDEIRTYWKLNKLVGDEFDHLVYVIIREHIEKENYQEIQGFFSRISVTKPLAKKNQGKVELCIHGYDEDYRELWEIPEVKKWMIAVEPLVKQWFFFLRTDGRCHGLKMLTSCVCDTVWAGRRPNTSEKGGKILFENHTFAMFLERNFIWLNEFITYLQLSIEENNRISDGVLKCFGLN